MKNIITCLTFFVSGFAVGYYTGGEVVRKVYRMIYKMLDEEVEKCRRWLNREDEKIMHQCDICEEMGCMDCENCYLGNPCIGCADYDERTHTCKSNGACGGEAEEEA